MITRSVSLLRTAAFVASAMLFSPAIAHEYTAGDLYIDHPWTRATPASASVGAGYLTIENRGNEADRLVGASVSNAESVEIHDMSVENNVMSMRKLEDGLEIPAGETVTLDTEGYHLMFIGLTAPLVEGEKIPGTLTFERAGTVDVEFSVDAAGKRESGHGAHGNHR